MILVDGLILHRVAVSVAVSASIMRRSLRRQQLIILAWEIIMKDRFHE
jgi:hypothetical protein